MMRVGFAGLGRMGVHMARNLIADGHEVTVWNRSAEKARAFASDTGCGVTGSLRDLATDRDAVLTMLADDSASEEVHFGSDGLFAGQGTAAFIEMGTMSPDHIRQLSEAAPAGACVIDAPVSGSTPAAKARDLLIIAGCDTATAAPYMPLFDAMGRQTICLGEVGAGAVMKLAVNTLIHGINQTLAEAMTLAGAAGIDPTRAFDVIEASAACAPMLKFRRPLYLGQSDEVTFTVSLARKDMELAAALSATYGVAMPQGDVTLQMLKAAEAGGLGAQDMAAGLRYMRGLKS